MSNRSRLSGLVLILLLTGALLGCGARREYSVSELDIHRNGWDTLVIDVSFAWETTIGGEHRFVPDSVAITVFDAFYRTLYAGRDPVIPLDDRRLGDRERLLVEVCGALGPRQICLQRAEFASPKRLHVVADVDYPVEGNLARGRYELTYTAERARADGTGWEPIPVPGEIRGHIIASVGGEGTNAVRVTFTGPRGSFDLSRLEGYADFKYYMTTALLEQQRAGVRFEIHGGFRGGTGHLATVDTVVSPKSEEERMLEVRHFVQEATWRIIDALEGFLGSRGGIARVRDWQYDPQRRHYEVDIDVSWRGGFFGGRQYELAGRLRVQEDGSAARFERTSGNPRALERWDERLPDDVLMLGSLPPPTLPDSLDTPSLFTPPVLRRTR